MIGVRFRSKRKLYSFIKESRGTNSHSRAQLSLTCQWSGCSLVFLSGKTAQSSRESRGQGTAVLRTELQADVRSAEPLRTALGWSRHRHLELKCLGPRISPGSWPKCPVARSDSLLGTLIPCVRCEASAHCP